MSYKKVTMVMMLILAFGGVPGVHAAGIPHMINYQGELTDPNGDPIHDPNLSMTFTFYDAPVDGNTLFSETQNVDVNDGLFGLLIGSASGPNGIPESVFAGQDVYLGIQVGTDSEMTPRQRVTSVAFAYWSEKAYDAESLEGQSASEFAGSDHNHDGVYSPVSHNHDGVYAPISHSHDDRYYTESEINSLFYTKSQIDSMFYTKTQLDPKLLTSSQKTELTGGGVTSLHYHPTGQLEAWPTYQISSMSGGLQFCEWAHCDIECGNTDCHVKLVGETSFSKVPGSTLFRVDSSCNVDCIGTCNGIRIETSLGTIEYYPNIDSTVNYEDLFDCSGIPDYTQIWVKLYVMARRVGLYTDCLDANPSWHNGVSATVYAQQNAP